MNNLKDLETFLVVAHKNTYANKTASKVAPTRASSKDYEFRQGDFLYHDTYFGDRDFIGEEIVYENSIPIWGMNYYGYLLKQDISEKEVYSFLRDALMQDCGDVIAVRGPSQYSSGIWSYQNNTDGTLEKFGGAESILLNGEEVYRCLFQGGLLT